MPASVNVSGRERLQRESTRMLWFLVGLCISAAAIGIVVILPYIYTFTGGISNDPKDWASLGDYVAGLLGPALGFLSLVALMATVRLQVQALLLAKEDIEITRDELSAAKESMEKQVIAWTTQMHSSAIFQTLGLHAQTISGAQYSSRAGQISGQGFLALVATDNSYFPEAESLAIVLARQIESALELSDLLSGEHRSTIRRLIRGQVTFDERAVLTLAARNPKNRERVNWGVLADECILLDC